MNTCDWLSISAYARAYSVSRATVYKWKDVGLLTTYQVDRCIRVFNLPPGEKPDVPDGETSPAPLLPNAEMRQIPVVARHAMKPAAPLIKMGREAVPSRPGVYVIRQGAAGKIGCAKDLQRRLQGLQIGFPYPLIVVGYITAETQDAARKLERRLHRQFKDERFRGEWFRLTDGIVQVLRTEGAWHPPALLVEAAKTNL